MFAIHTKQAPYMTYVIGARVPPRLGRRRPLLGHARRLPLRPPAGARSTTTHDLLIVGGEDHKTGQADDADQRHERLEAWARERFPMIEDVEFTWGGQVMETIDGLAFIGRNPLDKDNVYIATGDSGMGITHGTIAGMLLTDLILGRENPWEKLYDPSRKTLRAAGTFAKENLNVAGQYADWLTAGEVESVDEIAQGQRRRAPPRPDEGRRLPRRARQTHELSAVCPHLGCIVHWNNAEKPGTAPATARASTPTAKSSTARRISTSAPADRD